MSWVRQESRRSPGFYYYFNSLNGANVEDPPAPWQWRKSRSLPDVRYFWNEETGDTSLTKPEIETGWPHRLLRIEAQLVHPALPPSSQELQAIQQPPQQINGSGSSTGSMPENSILQQVDGAPKPDLQLGTSRKSSTITLDGCARLEETGVPSQATPPAKKKPKLHPSACSPTKDNTESNRRHIDCIAEKLQLRKPACMEDLHRSCKLLRRSIDAAGGEKFVFGRATTAADIDKAEAIIAKRLCFSNMGQTADTETSTSSESDPDTDDTNSESSADDVVTPPMPRASPLSKATSAPPSEDRAEKAEKDKKDKKGRKEKKVKQVDKVRDDKLVAEQAEVTKKTKKQHPAHTFFQTLDASTRATQFWEFFLQCALGKSSLDPVCNGHCLGGLSLLLPDVQKVCNRILVPLFQQDLADMLWRVTIVIWLGCGGPGFRTFDHIDKGVKVFGCSCPADARLPRLGDDAQLERMYNHLDDLRQQVGRSEILSGDGTYGQLRFEPSQGLNLLKSMSNAVSNLVAKLDKDSVGDREEHRRKKLASMGPDAVKEHFQGYAGFGPLAIKELFCYLEPCFPKTFAANCPPFGGGALTGAKLLLGDAFAPALVDHLTQTLIDTTLPQSLADEIRTAAMDRVQNLPANVKYLPGVEQQILRGNQWRPSVLDAEICFCWFQATLRARHSKVPKAPGKWHGFLYSRWPEAL